MRGKHELFPALDKKPTGRAIAFGQEKILIAWRPRQSDYERPVEYHFGKRHGGENMRNNRFRVD